MEETPMIGLYEDFPNINEKSLNCLERYPDGNISLGSLYLDLFGPPSNDPNEPSPLNSNKFLNQISQINSVLAHIIILQYSGAGNSTGIENTLMYNSIFKFSKLYQDFSAILIQRFWKYMKSKGNERINNRKLFKQAKKYYYIDQNKSQIDQIKFQTINSIIEMMKNI